MRLLVENLPRLADARALGEWFLRAGFEVTAVELVRDHSRDAHGAGFVVIENQDLAQRALRFLNGKAFWHRALVLRKAE